MAEIDVVPGCANLYRYHGANMGLGSGADDIDRILGKEIPWRRWMLRHLVHDPTVSAADLRAAYSSWEYGLVRPPSAPAAPATSCRDRGGARAQRARRRRREPPPCARATPTARHACS